MDVFLELSKSKQQGSFRTRKKRINLTIIEVLKPVDVFAVNKLFDEIFSIVFGFLIISVT
jgi:hypothetical protein